MGRNDELTARLDEFMHPCEHRQLSHRGQGGLRLVQYIEPAISETMEHERQERLPVRLLMERSTAVRRIEPFRVGRRSCNLIHITRQLICRLGPEEKSVLRSIGTPNRTERLEQRAMRCLCLEAERRRPTFRIESGGDGHSFDQRRFSTPILADQERDRLRHRQFIKPLKNR